MKWEEFRDQLLARPGVREEYEKLRPRAEALTELSRLMHDTGISHTELARRMGVSRGVLMRLLSMDHSPRLDALAAAARAMGYELRVSFERVEEAVREQRAS